MLIIKSGTQEEHLVIQLLWATSQLVVTYFSTINPVNGLL